MNNEELSKFTGLDFKTCDISGYQHAIGKTGSTYWLWPKKSGDIALTIEKKFHDVTHTFGNWEDTAKFILNKERANVD